ncbi:MAG: helix-turn-helix domain-containing protein [Deltaproteobacteria bacterium]|nr:helix-turn-helix domain-containing protein [Deltaproteobacteria bacterium]
MTLGERIRRARKAKGWTQAELAEKAGFSQPYVSHVELGRVGFSDGVGKLVALLGLDPDEALGQQVRSPVHEARPPRLLPQRLGPDVDLATYVKPDLGGDFFLFVPITRDELLVAAVDIAGNGAAALPAARYLQGWLRGRATAPGRPRLELLADALDQELADTTLEAAWFLALLTQSGSTSMRYRAVGSGYPAPLLLRGERGKTSPSMGGGRADGSWVVDIERLEPPFTLAMASDGLLRRLGAGDETAGKGVVRRWLTGEYRRTSPRKRFGTREVLTADESLAVLRWSPWDERLTFQVQDADERHRAQRVLREAAENVLGERADAICRATAEAIHNVLSHAYGPEGGKIEIRYRMREGTVEVEVEDAGLGTIGNGDGRSLMSHSCETITFSAGEKGHVVYLRCTSNE